MVSLIKSTSIDVYSKSADVLGEGPLWSNAEQTLYWLDISREMLYRQAPAELNRRRWHLPDLPGCLAELTTGSVAIAMGANIQQIDLVSGKTDVLFPAPTRPAAMRFNDGKVDPKGRLWVSTMRNNLSIDGDLIPVQDSDGELYRFDFDGCASTMEKNIGIANTLAWSPDSKRFYFADSLRGQIYVYDFDADSGALSGQRPFFELPAYGVPDGSAMDVDGCLWNARWDGHAIVRIAPSGALDRLIELPVARPTSCIFGGSNMSTLYVTSASVGLSAAQLKSNPLSGCVFALDGLAQGMPVPPLAGQFAQRLEAPNLP